MSSETRTREFGFWIYLMTDLILFTSLFATYAVMAREGSISAIVDLRQVFLETMLLLSSSATCAVAMVFMERRKKETMLFWLAATFLLGSGFVFIEIGEFARMIREGYGPQRNGLFSAFFTLVGTHGLHVSMGLLWMLVTMMQTWMTGLSSSLQSRMSRLAMFWHFLDIVWICVFTEVYLLGSLS
ncbi:MAG: cytochrome o ubiquinol oxidase subunit III [Burkholderiales bacterium]|nr:cytochrome o ubiquinol oxidase subunit III [Burkholderiales bacterium]